MANKQYIGARYVPKFDGEWHKEKSYESLTIVSYLNAFYTSKKPVPANTEITDSKYWVCTGNYNAQVEEYRQAVVDAILDVDGKIASIKEPLGINVEELGASTEKTQAENLSIINAAIRNGELGNIYIPKEIDYGYDRHADKLCIPDISASPNRKIVIDDSIDSSYDEAAERASQRRIWLCTPDPFDGQHDGNTYQVRAAYHPSIVASNDTDSDTNRRASFFLASKGSMNWGLQQGIYANDKDFALTRFNNDDGTVCAAVHYDTGNITIGGNLPNYPLAFAKSMTEVQSERDEIFTFLDSPNASTRTKYLQVSYTSSNKVNLALNGSTKISYSTDGNRVDFLGIADTGKVMMYTDVSGNLQEIRIGGTNNLTVSDKGRHHDLMRLPGSGVFPLGVSGGANTSVNRPSGASTGAMYFDTTLGKPIWFTGTKWVDASGNIV